MGTECELKSMSAPVRTEANQFDLHEVAEHLPIDDVLAALADSQRRAIIDQLIATGGDAVTVKDLISMLERSRSQADPNAEAPNQIRLYHVNLPKLADVGLIDWDHEHGIVQPTDSLLAIEPLLDLSFEL